MELRHLRYFVAVAEERHFGRAAERLHIAQPPLSHQIRQLEADLGVRLLTRTTRRVDLTPAGRSYLERCRAILSAVEAAGAEAERIAAGDVGELAMGFVGSATYDLLPTVARALRAGFPGIQLYLRGEMLAPDQIAGIVDGTLDIGFLRPPVTHPRIDVTVLRVDQLIAAVPSHHPLAARTAVEVSDLRDEGFVCYHAHHRSVVTAALQDACRRVGFAPRIAHEVAETSTLVSFVAAGMGVALVPAPVGHLRIPGVEYRPLAGDPQQVELAVATRTDPSPQVRRILPRIVDLIRGDVTGP